MATIFEKWKERSAARKASKAGAGYFPKPAEAAPTGAPAGSTPTAAAPAGTPAVPAAAPAPLLVESEGVTLRAAEPRTVGRPAKKATKAPAKKAAAKKAPAKKAAAKAPAKKAAAKKAPAKKAPAKKARSGSSTEPAVVRAWALSTGHPVAPRGRISQETYAAYAAANKG